MTTIGANDLPSFTAEQWDSPIFRLTCGKIYKIRNDEGEPEWFIPKPEQRQIIELIYTVGIKFLIILKARQLGMSTLISLINLDTIIWSTSVQTTLIDYNGDNARKKMVEKVIYAYDRLPPTVAALTSIRAKNTQTGEFATGPNVAHCSEADAKMRSSGFFGDQPRGGTSQFMHISEWSEIAARFPQRSADIKTGALSSAKRGVIVIETTWHGGKRGDVWPFVKAALETPPEHRTAQTPFLQFFAWWTDPNNRVKGSPEAIKPETHAYFAEIKRSWPKELDGIEFDHEQMLWYQETSVKIGVYMRGQNPTVLEECFQSIIKGAIWAEAIAKCRQEGRITNVPHDPTLEVDTFWDLGAPANTAIKFVQHRGGFHHLIASQQGGWSYVPDLVRGLKLRGYKYHIHFLPHDGAQTDRGGATFEKVFRDELDKQGVSGRIEIIKRANSVWPGVNHMTSMFEKLLIDQSCKKFIEAAENYRRRPDPNNDEKFTDDIVKDYTSHEADSARTMSEADLLGYLPSSGASVAIKPYFDPGSLKDASTLAASNQPHLFNLVCSDRPGYPIRHVSGLPHPYGGWLRVWDGPRPGHSYVLSLIGRSLQMWRCDSQESPLFLAAAPNWATLVDFGIIYRLAAQVSAYYGLAPIVLDVISHPGAVRELEALGANIVPRVQLEGRRPVGQEEPSEHPGWEWRPEVAQHAMVLLQTRIRQSRIVLSCPALIAQCAEITNDSEGRPESRDVVACDLVYGAALACSAHDFGSSYRPPMLETMQGVGYGAGQTSTTSGRMRNR